MSWYEGILNFSNSSTWRSCLLIAGFLSSWVFQVSEILDSIAQMYWNDVGHVHSVSCSDTYQALSCDIITRFCMTKACTWFTDSTKNCAIHTPVSRPARLQDKLDKKLNFHLNKEMNGIKKIFFLFDTCTNKTILVKLINTIISLETCSS